VARTLPVLDGPDGVIAVGADPSSDRRIVRRDLDRRIAIGGVAVSLAFIASTPVALALGGTTWAALHLLLAGAAGTAIAATMPFFAAALAVAPPASPWLRAATIAALAVGAVTIALAVPGGGRVGSLLGAGVYLIGLVGLAAATALPSRRGMGSRRGIIVDGYLAAVAYVIVGVALVLALLHGFAPVVARWALLKPAHAWLNLVGFVGIVVAASYIHLIPTVIGARIVEGRLPRMAIGGLAAGVALVAVGFALGSDAIVRTGAATTFVGVLAVPSSVVAAIRQPGRGRWTSALGWHRFVTWSLTVSACWFAVGIGAAGLLAIVHGASPAAWSLAIVGVPLVVGCIVQAIVASASHLQPTGGAVAVADRSRARLGWAARTRVVGFQIGAAGLWLGVTWPPADVIRPIAGGLLVLVVAGALIPLAAGVAGRVRQT
jgi:nitrite reductase (NO-forming)